SSVTGVQTCALPISHRLQQCDDMPLRRLGTCQAPPKRAAGPAVDHLLAREIIALRAQGQPAAEAAADTEEIVPEQTSDDLLALFDAEPLNRGYWVAFALLSALFVLGFFGF